MTKSLDAIMAGRDEPAPEVTNEAPTRTEAPEGSRDEQGRFAARREPEPKPTNEAPQEGAAEPSPAAPEGAEGDGKGGKEKGLHQARDAERNKRREAERERDAERARAQELERRIAALERGPQTQQPQAQPSDRLTELLTDPDAYLEKVIQERLQPVQSSQSEMREYVSEMMATRDHGAEVVEDAKGALEDMARSGNPAFQAAFARIQKSQHPYDEMVKWHREQAALTQYGADPEAYINAEIERRLAERTQQQPAADNPPAVLPTSFAASRNSGPRGAPAYGGPRPLSDIMKR